MADKLMHDIEKLTQLWKKGMFNLVAGTAIQLQGVAAFTAMREIMQEMDDKNWENVKARMEAETKMNMLQDEVKFLKQRNAILEGRVR